jgi:hypothetical protein
MQFHQTLHKPILLHMFNLHTLRKVRTVKKNRPKKPLILQFAIYHKYEATLNINLNVLMSMCVKLAASCQLPIQLATGS